MPMANSPFLRLISEGSEVILRLGRLIDLQHQ